MKKIKKDENKEKGKIKWNKIDYLVELWGH